MVRVTRPGGIVLAEFYNPYSLRALLKRFGPAGRIAASANESHVYTRFDSPFGLRKLLPPGTLLVGARGVRIVTPTAKVMKTALGRRFFRAAERALCVTLRCACSRASTSLRSKSAANSRRAPARMSRRRGRRSGRPFREWAIAIQRRSSKHALFRASHANPRVCAVAHGRTARELRALPEFYRQVRCRAIPASSVW